MSNTLDTITIANNCVCSDAEIETCYGECYDDAKENLRHLLNTWQEMNTSTDTIRIDGEKMGWQRLDGYAIVEVIGRPNTPAMDKLTDTLLETLRLNGDWTLVFKLSHDGHLSAVRYSHDEPTGAGFSVVFMS